MKKNYITPNVALYTIGMEGPICADSVQLTINRNSIWYEDYEEIIETGDISLL
jgi:hypothetical protein